MKRILIVHAIRIDSFMRGFIYVLQSIVVRLKSRLQPLRKYITFPNGLHRDVKGQTYTHREHHDIIGDMASQYFGNLEGGIDDFLKTGKFIRFSSQCVRFRS